MHKIKITKKQIKDALSVEMVRKNDITLALVAVLQNDNTLNVFLENLDYLDVNFIVKNKCYADTIRLDLYKKGVINKQQLIDNIYQDLNSFF